MISILALGAATATYVGVKLFQKHKDDIYLDDIIDVASTQEKLASLQTYVQEKAILGEAYLNDIIDVPSTQKKLTALQTYVQEKVVLGEAHLGDVIDVPSTQKKLTALQIYAQEKVTLILGETRKQQMAEFAGGEQQISEVEQKMDQAFKVACANIGIAGLSLVYSPLVIFTIPGLIYCSIPLFQLAYKTIFKEHRISSYIIDAGFVAGMFMGGFFQVGTVGTLFFVGGRKLLLKTENNAKQNLANLFGQQPRSVWVLVNNIEMEIPFEDMQTDDILIVSAGQAVPVDGIIIEGIASIDQRMLTGEAQPVEKSAGDPVLAATFVLAGKIYIETQKTGQETVAMQIGDVLNHTADFKSLMESRGEVIADKMVIPTLGLSALLFPFFGLSSTLAVLANTFGYKMRLFAPASMLSFLNVTSQQGILIKDGRSLELLGQVDTIVFDKTGTLTLEQPTVANIHSFSNIKEDDILRYAAVAEYGQTHPIACAILTAANQRQLQRPQFDYAKYEVGYGIQVTLADRIIHVGSKRFMDLEAITVPPQAIIAQENCYEQGHSLVMVAFDKHVVGAIELHTTLRPEAKQMIHALRQRNMAIYIISGDNEQPTKKLAETLGIDHYFANTLPENKADIVAQLQAENRSVCFVGDGINDSIALKRANVSVSLRGATTMATDTAQIVLMDGTLNRLEYLFDISQKFEANMRNNLLLSVIPSAVCLGGVLLFHWGVFTGIIITSSTLFVGIGNTLLPLLQSENGNGNHYNNALEADIPFETLAVDTPLKLEDLEIIPNE